MGVVGEPMTFAGISSTYSKLVASFLQHVGLSKIYGVPLRGCCSCVRGSILRDPQLPALEPKDLQP